MKVKVASQWLVGVALAGAGLVIALPLFSVCERDFCSTLIPRFLGY